MHDNVFDDIDSADVGDDVEDDGKPVVGSGKRIKSRGGEINPLQIRWRKWRCISSFKKINFIKFTPLLLPLCRKVYYQVVLQRILKLFHTDSDFQVKREQVCHHLLMLVIIFVFVFLFVNIFFIFVQGN